MQFQWAMHNITQYSHENYIVKHYIQEKIETHTKSNNITKLLTKLKKAIEVMERTKVTIISANIRTSKSTY